MRRQQANRRDPVSEDDVEWVQNRTIELMHMGIVFVEAAHLATTERTQWVLDRNAARERASAAAATAMRKARLAENEKQESDDLAGRRAALEARARQAQPPTLRTSLGDMLKAKATR